jgi:peptidoglycan/LPS O-acetylase OafA/YrhL
MVVATAATGVRMGFYSIWPYFAGMAVILLFASTPLLNWADTPPKAVPARVRTMDGLRGFLALGVVFHHAAVYHQYLQTGRWHLPPTRFYADLGQIGVAMFFMVTGYLFWTQMLKAEGKLNLPKLYLGRIFRIVPLYLFLVVVVLLIVCVLTQWRLREPPLALVKHVSIWLAGGVLMGGDVNGYTGTGLISAYVTWSLQYEWMFYASLLVTSFVARKSILGAVLPVAGLLVAAPLLQFHPNTIPLAAALMFCVGMTTASAKSVFAAKPIKIPQWALSTGVIGCLALVLLLCDDVYSTLPILMLGVAFALVVFDATVFGLLLTRPAKRLGDISYSIYLLQGPVLFLLFAPPSVRSLVTESAWVHWTVVMLAMLALVMLSTITHALIERPGIQAGQWMWAKVVHSLSKRGLPSTRSRVSLPAQRT